MSGEARVPTKNLNTSTVPDEPSALENLLNANGDSGPEPTLPPHVSTFLGEQLQAFYAHLMNEPVPERLIQLLAELNRKQDGRHGE